MKRDMDFIRQLLLDIENGRKYLCTFSKEDAKNQGRKNLDDFLNPEAAKKLEHHLWLLEASSLVTFEQISEGWLPNHITWQGHDLLDSIRDPEIWRMTKEGAEKAGGFTVEILGALAKGFIKTKIEKHTGVEL